MARKPDLSDLLDKYEPSIAKAFLAAIQEITSGAQIGRIAEALERGDVNAAIEAISLDRAAFGAFEEAIRQAYIDGGLTTVNGLPTIRNPDGSRFVVRFDVRNLRAEQWLREHSSRLVTRITEEQRALIRLHVEAALREGRNPKTVALDIIGRINRATGRREGGIVGLSAPQERAVAKALEELIAGEYSAYLRREQRDKRFDRTIAKAQREGRQLTREEAGKIVARYSDNLLNLRGMTIGRTEALASLHEAQYEALKQLVDSGKVKANQVRRIWDSAGDVRVRFDHAVADGQSVGLDEDFTIGGRAMRYPGDPRGGPDQVINCRCVARTRIDFLANVR